jgi:tetratricopeptide (TPR) repeat protein
MPFTIKGRCLYQQNRLDEALVSYDMAIKHNPANSAAYNNKGNCLRDLNRLEEALASYDMAIKHNPNNVNALNNRKLLLKQLKSKSNCKQQ